MVGLETIESKSIAKLQQIAGSVIVETIRESRTTPEDSRLDSPGQVKAGTDFHSSTSSTGNGCTAGFGARNAAGDYFVLTAGHCPGSTYLHNRQTIGVVPAGMRIQNGNTDALAVRAFARQLVSNEIWDSETNRQVVTSAQAPGAVRDGDMVCKSGIHGRSCGTVYPMGSSATILTNSGITYNDMVLASYTSTGGDSGSPIYLGNQALGVHHGATNLGRRVYTKVGNATARLGVTLLLDLNPATLRSDMNPNMCADIQGNDTTDGTPIWLWPCDSGDAQRFVFRFNYPYQITRDVGRANCLDFDSNQNFDGGKVQLWTCIGPSQLNQLFFFERDPIDASRFRLRATGNAKCIDVPNGNQQTFLNQYTCHTGPQQRWFLGP